ncbi:MAG: hypothetical protein A3H68_01875 [Candidatus Taylorbacteria bacterium RIFCSPLOWO2_02_FULL_46_40]|uniref:Uncharacterized protein n=1 Tax=Candidatus Taylorbacteria bacterium RIFCSPLOWO2_02_FULL_46_40 TaxID=1802329 RepID=A0A1G2P2Z8_9BACT|nr:MAG: hypothetical protein A3H68_01875 [Candidatus Taylorbacteria bacterium RIFCSPLOWO2_02_FULL_46_40]
MILSIPLPQELTAAHSSRTCAAEAPPKKQKNRGKAKSFPPENGLKDARPLDKIASDTDLFVKKVCAKEIFGSHLFLGEKTLRPAEGGNPNSFGKMGGNQWDALRASHLLALKKPLSSVLVSLLYQARTYFQNR